MNFSREDTQVTDRYMKSCSVSLIIREMQIKTTIYYYLTSVRMAGIKNSNGTRQHAGEDTGKSAPSNTVLECKVQPHGKQYGGSSEN